MQQSMQDYLKTVTKVADDEEEIPHLEVMDFYVPSYPYKGGNFEMTCGFKHFDELTFHRIEWHRNKIMFFRYMNNKGHLYSHDWIDNSLISYNTEEIEIKHVHEMNKTRTRITVLKLDMHNANTKMSGRYDCHVFMSMMKKDEEIHVPANRSSLVKVVDPNDPEKFLPNVRIENITIADQNGLECIGEGNPAPHLAWNTVDDDSNLAPVLEESIETFPINFDPSINAEVSKVRITGQLTGRYACIADSRIGAKETHFIETEMVDDDLSWTYEGTTTTEAPPVVEEEEDIEMFYIIIGGVSGALAFLLLMLLICCCHCIRKRKNDKAKKRLLAAIEREKLRVQMIHYRERRKSAVNSRRFSTTGTIRSTRSRSMKRKAPVPVSVKSVGSMSTISMTP